MTAPDRIALRWELGAAVTSGPLMDHPDYTQYVRADLMAELTDPIAVHANMLRGTIAKPTVEQIIHLYGVDALCKALVPVIVQEAGHNPAPDLAELDAAKIIQKRIDAIIQEEGSWEPDTNVTNLPEWAETAVEELEGILAKIKEPQT